MQLIYYSGGLSALTITSELNSHKNKFEEET